MVNLLVSRSGYDIHHGLAYGTGPRQKLDVYVPRGLKVPAPGFRGVTHLRQDMLDFIRTH